MRRSSERHELLWLEDATADAHERGIDVCAAWAVDYDERTGIAYTRDGHLGAPITYREIDALGLGPRRRRKAVRR